MFIKCFIGNYFGLKFDPRSGQRDILSHCLLSDRNYVDYFDGIGLIAGLRTIQMI